MIFSSSLPDSDWFCGQTTPVFHTEITHTTLGQRLKRKRVSATDSSVTEPVALPSTHRIPFGVHLFLLELGELSPVVNDHQQLPDEQQGQANQHDAGDHTCDDRDDVGPGGAV